MASTSAIIESTTTMTKTALHVETKSTDGDRSRGSLPKKRPKIRLYASSSNLSDESGGGGRGSSTERSPVNGGNMLNNEMALPSLSSSDGDVSSNRMSHLHNPLNGTASSNSDEMDYGLLISINDNGQCQVQFCADANFRQIHPNIYAPDALQDVTKLGGGGSGVAVFSAKHPDLGSVVMKHGGYKDMVELFALAQIAEELKRRGAHSNNNEAATEAAARDMQQRIPEFKMIYASPYHFRERGAAFWENLKVIIKSWSLFTLHGEADGTPACTPIEASSKRNHSIRSINEGRVDENKDCNDSSLSGNGGVGNSRSYSKGVFFRRTSSVESDQGMEKSKGKPPVPPPSPMINGVRPSVIIKNINPHGLNFGRSIRIYESDGFDEGTEHHHGNVSFQLDSNCASVALVFKKDTCDFLDDGRTVVMHGSSFDGLKGVVDELLPLMTDKLFKFTLGQKSIGEVDGRPPTTGNQLLYAGNLHGPLLDTLVSQFIEVTQNLRRLTLPEEVDVVDFVRDEVTSLEEDYHVDQGNITAFDASDLSNVSDTFVGNAIKKNFHPEKGRARLLEVLGKLFRELPDDLIILPEEEVPVFHLGTILRSGALMGDTFQDVPMEATILQPDQYYWRNVLKRAVEDRPGRSSAAFERIWTCGLTDAGIHNLFLSEDKVWFFDLGEPQLQSIPGFMTKFLFSFLHTLGMQEEPDNPLEPNNPNKSWVRRFRTINSCNKLALTGETKQLLPKAYDALEVCLDRIINEVFDGDNSLRWLLLQYITLQLMSDAGFCLTRWQVKGGGRERKLNHNKAGLEKWLWRALWDIYVAYDINTKVSWTRFGIEHPSQC